MPAERLNSPTSRKKPTTNWTRTLQHPEATKRGDGSDGVALSPSASSPRFCCSRRRSAGYLKWQDATARDADLARGASVQAAKDATVSMLSYQPDTVDRDLEAARKLLTGEFQNSYTSLTRDVVIPGAKQKRISAVATVPAAASVSASPRHAVVVVFVDQTVAVGSDAPSDTASTVRVTLDKVGDHWLIAGFDPI